ncbi:hypothetical protein ACP70R_008778 [Stipagrostis hirtigluma subsp. patula]
MSLPGLPPAASADARAAAASYISRISLLMEEEEDAGDVEPDHPALLQAQRPFAQILSGAVSPDKGAVFPGGVGDPATPTLGSKDAPPVDEYSEDMFAIAFFKGLEEATKFLPASHAGDELLKEKGRRGRSGDDDLEAEAGRTTKVAAVEPDEAGAREMFDEMMLRGYDACSEEMEGLSIATDKGEAADGSKRARKKNRARGKRHVPKAIDLHALLTCCANALNDDRRSAEELLKQIKQHTSPTAGATQRLAHCFVQGLEARLAGIGSQLRWSLAANRAPVVVEFLKAYRLFMSTCCFRKVAFAFANKTIFDVAAGRSKLHIVDYGLHCGFQWTELMRLLRDRDGGPPEVRITSIDLPQSGFRPAKHMVETGHRLSNCARAFGVPFKFHAMVAQWETVCIHDLNVEPDEVLVVNDLFNFRTLMDESVVTDTLSPRDVVLNNISKMKPDVFIQGVVNLSCSNFFFARFRETLFYYSALFDMLDATIPRESQLRLVLERDIFGQVAMNAIACEGEDRVERGETYRQWHLRNQRAGLRQLPLNRETVKMVKDIVKNHYNKNFVIEEGLQWLLQGWKGRILFAHSTWVADSTAPSVSFSEF